MGQGGDEEVTQPEHVERYWKRLVEISRKWRKVWEEKGLHQADPEPGRPKMFLTAAYPYPNGPLHLGHGLTYTIPDVIARFYRMRGYRVLFPMGFHFTGTPVVTMAEAVKRRDPSTLEVFTKLYGVPEEDLPRLETPEGMASYFKDWAVEDLRSLLLSIDWRRSFTTIDPEYKAFITWQFITLNDKGLLVQGTHPVGWCPVHHNPVSMHDTKGDVEPEIQEFTTILFPLEDKPGVHLPTATLRPETLLGVTNIWVNPQATYVHAVVDGKEMILSDRAFFKIRFQAKSVEEKHRVKGEKLVGWRARNPLTGKVVPVLPSPFVDPDTGTGVVMSVPAHAPYDYAALKTLKQNPPPDVDPGLLEGLEPIPLIEVPGYGELPAAEAVEKAGVKSVEEREKLDELTKQVYKDEHEKGVMRKDAPGLVGEGAIEGAREFVAEWMAGLPVSRAREEVASWLRRRGFAIPFYEIANKPVYCRCGNEIVVKVLENQWFLDYENPQWKELARKALRMMEIVPNDYRPQFEYTIEWLKKRACARSRGLGTPLPWDPSWIIESLSDSTIYMAFYTVIHHIRRAGISAESLSREFWDYVFLGKGDAEGVSANTGVPPELLEEMRSEFNYWYPLDNRHSAKDLIPNHLTFFIFNHAAIFPEDKWPRRIVVNGYILVEGAKMSKSLGNVRVLRNLINSISPDVLRLSLISGSEVGNDVNLTMSHIISTTETLMRIEGLVERALTKTSGGEPEKEPSVEDRLLETRFSRLVEQVTRSLERYRLREASVAVYSLAENMVSKYLEENPNPGLLRRVVSAWIRMMAPFTPAFAEELWSKAVGEGLVHEREWPKAEDFARDPLLEVGERLVEMIASDVDNIASAAKKKPRRVTIVVSGDKELMKRVLDEHKKGSDMKSFTRLIASSLRGDRRPHETARRIVEFLNSLEPEHQRALEEGFDEKTLLETLAPVMERALGAEVRVMGLEEAERQGVGLRRRPAPLFPAISIEFAEE